MINVVLTLDHRQRRRPKIKTTLVQRIVFARYVSAVKSKAQSLHHVQGNRYPFHVAPTSIIGQRVISSRLSIHATRTSAQPTPPSPAQEITVIKFKVAAAFCPVIVY